MALVSTCRARGRAPSGVLGLVAAGAAAGGVSDGVGGTTGGVNPDPAFSGPAGPFGAGAGGGPGGATASGAAGRGGPAGGCAWSPVPNNQKQQTTVARHARAVR